MKTITEQVKSARRILAKREAEYPRLVAAGKMNKDIAEHELKCAMSIVATLEMVEMLRGVSEEMKGSGGVRERGSEEKPERKEPNEQADQSNRVV